MKYFTSPNLMKEIDGKIYNINNAMDDEYIDVTMSCGFFDTIT